MISVQEIVVDPDMIAPHPFTILRSTGQFVPGGFASTTVNIPMFGPVQQASLKEIQMLTEADRVGSVRSFWSTRPIYVTRGYAPVPSVHGEVPQGTGVDYTITEAPPDSALNLYAGGLLLRPNGIDYVLTGVAIVFNHSPAQPLYATWQVTANVATNASDILQYGEAQYRVLLVYFDPGGGYHKALATRTAAA
jgi:hypothetical protein